MFTGVKNIYNESGALIYTGHDHSTQPIALMGVFWMQDKWKYCYL